MTQKPTNNKKQPLVIASSLAVATLLTGALATTPALAAQLRSTDAGTSYSVTTPAATADASDTSGSTANDPADYDFDLSSTPSLGLVAVDDSKDLPKPVTGTGKDDPHTVSTAFKAIKPGVYKISYNAEQGKQAGTLAGSIYPKTTTKNGVFEGDPSMIGAFQIKAEWDTSDANKYVQSNLAKGAYIELAYGEKAGTLHLERIADFEGDITPDTKTSNVTFNEGSDFHTVVVETGKTVAKPADPVKDGSEFTGWQLDGKPYDFTEPVTKDITLTAGWKDASDAGQDTQAQAVTIDLNKQAQVGFYGTSDGNVKEGLSDSETVAVTPGEYTITYEAAKGSDKGVANGEFSATPHVFPTSGKVDTSGDGTIKLSVRSANDTSELNKDVPTSQKITVTQGSYGFFTGDKTGTAGAGKVTLTPVKTTPDKPGTGLKGDANKDGKYTAADLNGVTITADGKAIWQNGKKTGAPVSLTSKITVDNVPEKWVPMIDNTGSKTELKVTFTSPDKKVTVPLTFAYGETTKPDTPDKPDQSKDTTDIDLSKAVDAANPGSGTLGIVALDDLSKTPKPVNPADNKQPHTVADQYQGIKPGRYTITYTAVNDEDATKRQQPTVNGTWYSASTTTDGIFGSAVGSQNKPVAVAADWYKPELTGKQVPTSITIDMPAGSFMNLEGGSKSGILHLTRVGDLPGGDKGDGNTGNNNAGNQGSDNGISQNTSNTGDATVNGQQGGKLAQTGIENGVLAGVLAIMSMIGTAIMAVPRMLRNRH